MVSVFLFRHPKCHFLVLENRHFCRKCPFSIALLVTFLSFALVSHLVYYQSGLQSGADSDGSPQYTFHHGSEGDLSGSPTYIVELGDADLLYM